MKIKRQSHRQKFSIRHPKRVILISAIALVLLATGVYGFFSYQNWNGLSKRSGEAAVSLRSEIESTLGSKELTAKLADQIDTIIKNFERKNGEKPCESPRVYEWQTVIPALKKDKDSCEQKLANARATIQTMKPLSVFLKDQSRASTVLLATVEATKNPTDYTSASASWKTLTTSSELSQNKDFKPISDSIITSAERISNAYAALAAANKDESRAAFDEALEKLKVGYGTLVTVTAASQVEQTRLATAIVTAYEKL